MTETRRESRYHEGKQEAIYSFSGAESHREVCVIETIWTRISVFQPFWNYKCTHESAQRRYFDQIPLNLWYISKHPDTFNLHTCIMHAKPTLCHVYNCYSCVQLHRCHDNSSPNTDNAVMVRTDDTSCESKPVGMDGGARGHSRGPFDSFKQTVPAAAE